VAVFTLISCGRKAGDEWPKDAPYAFEATLAKLLTRFKGFALFLALRLPQNFARGIRLKNFSLASSAHPADDGGLHDPVIGKT
jgi:hypothetical protein